MNFTSAAEEAFATWHEPYQDLLLWMALLKNEDRIGKLRMRTKTPGQISDRDVGGGKLGRALGRNETPK